MSKLAIQGNVTLAPFTTINLGGPARHFAKAISVDQVIEALEFAQEQQLNVHVLGGGSNTIFSDQGFDGLVLQVALSGIKTENQGRQVLVTAAAGEPWDDLVEAMVKQGHAGFECMSGIPGLVGATPMQNVGAYGQDVSETIQSVTALDRQSLELKTFTNDECDFEYRGSRFKYENADRYIVTEVSYLLERNGTPTVTYPELVKLLGGTTAIEKLGTGASALKRVRQAVLELRRSKSMVVSQYDENSRSCGSFFINPIVSKEVVESIQVQGHEPPVFPVDEEAMKIPAAWLIETAGFNKGYRLGGVGISENHPLALVNYHGTTEELLQLASQIKEKVKTTFGVELKQEPILIG